MEWETSSTGSERLKGNGFSKMRSLSTSTPLITAPANGKLFRSNSISICSSNDSGLGDSLLNTSGTDIFNTPDFDLNVSTCSNFSIASTSTVCPTPKTALFNTASDDKRRQLEFTFSPVLNFKQKNIAPRRNVSTDYGFASDEQNDTLSEESAKYLSRLNLDSGIECSSSDSVSHIPKLNLDIDNVSPVACLSTSNLEVKFHSSTETACESPPEEKLSPKFEAFLQQFVPEERDRLIGGNVGIGYVDILKELHIRGMAQILSTIFRYVDTSDLSSIHAVSAAWRTSIESDRQANKRRKEYLKKKRKPEFHGKENMSRKKSPSPPSRNVAGAGPLQALGNLQLQNPTTEVTPERQTTRLDLFVEASKKLKSEERLQKCPRCCKPAKVLPVQERGICLQTDCAFDYCINCYNEFHRSQPCVQVSLKRAKTDTVGHKKSKKNLKRL